MKKYFCRSFAVMALGTALLTACVEDNNNSGTMVVAMTDGVYVLGSGNMYAGIDGNLTYYDFDSKTATTCAFQAANGKSLGKTPNDVLQYGSKLYIAVDGENTVFVLDGKTLKQVAALSTTEMMGEEDGISPRRLTGSQGIIYVSTYGGYVAAIDTLNFTLKNKYKAGSYPEGIFVMGDYLFVANSDYGMGQNPSISRILLSTGVDDPLTNENIRNPQSLAVTTTGDIYFLDYGSYGPAPDYEQTNAGVYCVSGSQVRRVIPDATAMGCAGNMIYAFSALYGKDVKYFSYNVTTGHMEQFSPEGIESPAAIEVDPVTGIVFIASYHTTTSDYGTFADYSAPAYVNVYGSTLSAPTATFACGVGPARIAFCHSSKTVNY